MRPNVRLKVATVLTVYGIETSSSNTELNASTYVATVLTVYGIETEEGYRLFIQSIVATVLTVYGIETLTNEQSSILHSLGLLQQYLPFTVLKLFFGGCYCETETFIVLQQYLPFTVLKLIKYALNKTELIVATVLTVYGIETKAYSNSFPVSETLQQYLPFTVLKLTTFCFRIFTTSCNSTYRLRY